MTYDVIILSYKRPQNIERVVNALICQDPVPNEITVWHNAPSKIAVPSVNNVVADINYTCRARHAFGLLSKADALLFIDDDLLLRSERVAGQLIEGLTRHPDSVVGFWGMRCGDDPHKPYTGGKRHRGEEAATSVVLGKLHMIRRELLHHAFSRDLLPDVAGEDDIVLSASVQMATGQPSWIVAGIERAWLDDLRDEQGNDCRPDHWRRRNLTCRRMIELGWRADLWKTTQQ